MMVCITGTPGTGKSAVSAELANRGYPVVHVTDLIEAYITGYDEDRQTRIIDTDRWVHDFVYTEGFIEGHLSHLLPCDKVVVLRCHPHTLKNRLMERGYTEKKMNENVEAELIDLILVEALEEHGDRAVFEIDTTKMPIPACADVIEEVYAGIRTPSSGIVSWLAGLADEL